MPPNKPVVGENPAIGGGLYCVPHFGGIWGIAQGLL
jgi:hypothetical protein